MKLCKCGSQMINPGKNGRENDNPELCDVCYWQARCEDLLTILIDAYVHRIDDTWLKRVRDILKKYDRLV